MVICS